MVFVYDVIFVNNVMVMFYDVLISVYPTVRAAIVLTLFNARIAIIVVIMTPAYTSAPISTKTHFLCPLFYFIACLLFNKQAMYIFGIKAAYAFLLKSYQEGLIIKYSGGSIAVTS